MVSVSNTSRATCILNEIADKCCIILVHWRTGEWFFFVIKVKIVVLILLVTVYSLLCDHVMKIFQDMPFSSQHPL